MKKRKTNSIVCSDCIHFYACSMWNVGTLYNTNATNCYNFETYEDAVKTYNLLKKKPNLTNHTSDNYPN